MAALVGTMLEMEELLEELLEEDKDMGRLSALALGATTGMVARDAVVGEVQGRGEGGGLETHLELEEG